eukprot:TRINITY_DN16867_c1_g1_i1.p1 TRINITY_DN16867_c1_g1~~TRINITY_DN16867_c1_g1_i1.p1  ORF type:complete len:1557 (+),score=425.51 TRINITY_DN16867_c1_g1_i1:98-4672(+)
MARLLQQGKGNHGGLLDTVRKLRGLDSEVAGWSDDLAVKINILHERLTRSDETGESRMSRAMKKRPDYRYLSNEEYAEECDKVVLGSSKWINRHSNGIPFDKLRDIKLLFEIRQTHDQAGFSEEDFVEVFAPVFCPSQDPNQVRIWFMGIDQDANGCIDWDEFSAYLMKTKHGGADAEASKSVFYISKGIEPEAPQSAPLPINRIVYNQHLNVYYTAASDGTVRMWDGVSLEERGVVHYGEGCMIHSLHYLPDTKRLVVGQFDRLSFVYTCGAQRRGSSGGHRLQRVFKGENVHKGNETRVNSITKLCEYDPDSMIMENSTPQYFTQVMRAPDSAVADRVRMQGANAARVGRYRIDVVLMDELNRNVQCMEPMHSVYTDRADPFVFGTEDGIIYLFNLALRDESTAEGQSVSHITVQHLEPGQHVKRLDCWHPHTDWVTHLQSAPALQGFISSSMDSSIQVLDVNKGKSYLRMEIDADPLLSNGYDGGRGRGVHSFDYAPERNLLCSCGISREAVVWNPKARQRMCTLSEHRAALVSVKFVEKNSQLITLSEDKIIKIWDVRMFRCMQTLTDKERRFPEDKYSGLGYDTHNDAILCGAGVPVVWRDADVQAKMETGVSWHPEYEGHLSPIIACAYNSRFQHLLSADDKHLHVWDLHTGKRLSKWSPLWQEGVHDGNRLTAATFDSDLRRILTGTDNGAVDMWSLDGRRLKSFAGMSVEVSCVLHIVAHEGQSHAQSFVVAGGFGTKCAVWVDSAITAAHRVPVQDGAHLLSTFNSHVHCLAFSPPNKLAIGTANGAVLLYNINNMSLMSENKSLIGSSFRKMRATEPDSDEAQSPGADDSPSPRSHRARAPAAAPQAASRDDSPPAAARAGARVATESEAAVSPLSDASCPPSAPLSPSASPPPRRRELMCQRLLRARQLESSLDGAQEFTMFRSTAQMRQLAVTEALIYLPHPTDPARLSDAIVTLHGDGDALVWRLKDGYFLEIAACFPGSFSAGEAAYALAVDKEHSHVYVGDGGSVISVFDLQPYTIELERMANMAKAQSAVALAQRMVQIQAKRKQRQGSLPRPPSLAQAGLTESDVSMTDMTSPTHAPTGRRKGGRPMFKGPRDRQQRKERPPVAEAVHVQTDTSTRPRARRGPSGRIYHNRCGVRLLKCFDIGAAGALTQLAVVPQSPILVAASNDCTLSLVNRDTCQVLSRFGCVTEFPGSWPTGMPETAEVPSAPMTVQRSNKPKLCGKHRFAHVFPDDVQGSSYAADSLRSLEEAAEAAAADAAVMQALQLSPRSRRRQTVHPRPPAPTSPVSATSPMSPASASDNGVALPCIAQRPSTAAAGPPPELHEPEAQLGSRPSLRAATPPIGTRRSVSAPPAEDKRPRRASAQSAQTQQQDDDAATDDAAAEARLNHNRLERYLSRYQSRSTPSARDSVELQIMAQTQNANDQVMQLMKSMQRKRGRGKAAPNLRDYRLRSVPDDLGFSGSSPRTYQDQCRWVPPGHAAPERQCKHCRRHRGSPSPVPTDRLPGFVQ